MHVRVVRFTGVRADRVEGAVAQIKESGRPPPGVPGEYMDTLCLSAARRGLGGRAGRTLLRRSLGGASLTSTC